MYKRLNRKTMRLIGYFASVMMLMVNLSAASFLPVAEAATDQALTMDKLKYLPGEAITLSYTGAGASGKDWVGIYKTGDVPPESGVSLRWGYLKSGDGKVSLSNGLALGTYDALYMRNDGYEIVDRKTFEVVERVPVDGVSIDHENVTMTEGETVTLKAMVTPANANNPHVSWTSSDSAIVSVTATSGSASLTGHRPGTATVMVTTADGNFTSSANVTVEANLPLQDIIASAQAKFDAAVEGNADGLYVAGSKAQLQSAMDAANAIASDSNASPEQVNHARAALNEAIQRFDQQNISADLSGDGKISAGDLAIVAGGYGKQPDQADWDEKADVNHDGKVDVVDLQIVAIATLQ